LAQYALIPGSPFFVGKTPVLGVGVAPVVERDRSMEGMVQSGEEWMKPLWDYREMLLDYRAEKQAK